MMIRSMHLPHTTTSNTKIDSNKCNVQCSCSPNKTPTPPLQKKNKKNKQNKAPSGLCAYAPHVGYYKPESRVLLSLPIMQERQCALCEPVFGFRQGSGCWLSLAKNLQVPSWRIRFVVVFTTGVGVCHLDNHGHNQTAKIRNIL